MPKRTSAAHKDVIIRWNSLQFMGGNVVEVVRSAMTQVERMASLLTPLVFQGMLVPAVPEPGDIWVLER